MKCFVVSTGFYRSNTRTVADRYYLEKYYTEMTPAEWTLYVASVIYVWQAVWLMYGLTTFFGRVDGGHFYSVFPVLPPILYIVFSFSLACNISWLLIWDREYMEVALVFINLMACTLFICLIITLKILDKFGNKFAAQNRGREIWLIRILVHNSLAMFATWAAVVAIFNFTVEIIYPTGADQSVGSTVSLAFFTMEILTFWLCDIFVFDNLLRYLLSPYVVLLISLFGICQNNWDPRKVTSICTTSLLALSILLTVIKTILMIHRHKIAPVFTSKRHHSRLVS